MILYDLFIKGIHPDRLDEAEQIKKKVSQYFKAGEDKLEILWSTPSGLCIQRSISKEEVNKIQNTLTKAGLICHNSPSLTLIEKTEKRQDFSCPYCEIKIKLDNDEQEPLECPGCSGIIAKYAETQERIEIRNRLMNSKAAKDWQKLQLSKSEAERIRKQRIEDEIKQEIFGKQKRIVASKKLLFVASTAILVVLGSTYILTTKENKNTTATSALSEDNASTAKALSVEAPTSSYASGGVVDTQTALQDTHDKANKVLGAFGLDADKIGKNAGNATLPIKVASNFDTATSGSPIDSKTTLQDTQEKANKVLGTFDSHSDKISTNPENPTASIKTPTNSSNGDNSITITQTITPEAVSVAFTIALLDDSENHQEWDLFLNQQITDFLKKEKLAEAYKIGQYIVDTEVYIHTMGLLLAHAKDINHGKVVEEIMTAIESRINALPISNQAEYLAQAGFEQLRIYKKNDLLIRSETLWKQIPNSYDQLKAALKIAVYNFKSGNIKAANNYFGIAHKLLDKNKSPDQQVSVRAALGRAYYDVNESDNAGKWLASTEVFLPKVTIATLKELVGSYAYTNQWQKTTLQNIATEKQSELLYVAVQVSLKNNALNNALTINKNIQDPNYIALASGLIASYDSSKANSYLDIAEKQMHTIELPSDKAIVASCLSRSYSRIGNTQKVAQLMKESEKNLESLPSSIEKDNVLIPVIRNFAQAFQFENAYNLTFFIHSEDTKSSIKNEINLIKKESLSL